MRLFHFSDERDIDVFEPIDGVVWAIDDEMAVNYLFPRECPRVTFGVWESTNDVDRSWFASVAAGARRVLVIESGWLDRVRSAELFRYEFGTGDFELRDGTAGYWTAPSHQEPTAIVAIGDLESAIESAGGLLRSEVSVWPTIDRIVNSSLRFSVIRQRNAVRRQR